MASGHGLRSYACSLAVVTTARFFELLRKARHKSAREIASRVDEEVRRVARRPWAHIYPAVLTDRTLLAAHSATSIDELWRKLTSAPFFVAAENRGAIAAEFRRRYPDGEAEVIADAERVLRHEFDLLGSGPRCLGPELPWHEDFKTGRVWPLQYSPSIEYSELDRPTDVKVPWELSRCQHVPRLGQAYWLTGDEKYAREFVCEVDDWIDKNPWGYGVNWACAMDVALRAISWIWAAFFFAESPALGSSFRGRLLRSLYLHAEYVAAHLERGPVNGNHYLSDGVGLVFLGCFFKRSAKGQQWLATGRAIVLEEMPLQVTSDGVDFEASTAYHRLVLELFLTAYVLLRHNGETIPAPQWTRLEKMFDFVAAYTKPDGRAPLIGDADDGRVQMLGRQPVLDHRYLLSTGAVLFNRAEFKRDAGRFWEESFWFLGPQAAAVFDALPADVPARRSQAFSEGGFFILRSGASHVVVDCGNVGMRGIGGHGHNDILSFELVLDGFPLVTDCGAYLYTASREWRNKFRSTEFHSTIQVDGEEVNRFISPLNLWQLHDDANPVDPTLIVGDQYDLFEGGHDGYLRLPVPIMVRRRIVLHHRQSRVDFTDRLDGSGRHHAVWRFPIEPGVSCEIAGGGVRFSCGDGERWLQLASAPSAIAITLEPGWVSPSYGVRHPATVVVFRAKLTLPFTLTYSFLASPDHP
jgi:hypothetical protein